MAQPATSAAPDRWPRRGGPGGARRARNLSPREGAEEAEQRTGLPRFHVGQKVQGMFGCVACQFQIRNRGALPTCPQCGEIIWAYLESGPRPVPEGEEPRPRRPRSRRRRRPPARRA